MNKYEEAFLKQINKAFDYVVYVSGYKTSKSRVKIECTLCGNVEEKSVSTVRSYITHRSNFKCSKCGVRHNPRYVGELKELRYKSQDYIDDFNNKYTNVEYVNTDETRATNIRFRCKTCGKENDTHYHTPRNWEDRTSIFVCDGCGKSVYGVQVKEVCNICGMIKANLSSSGTCNTCRLEAIKQKDVETRNEYTRVITERATGDMNGRERNFKESREAIHEHLTYMRGYENEHSSVYLRCDKCGTVDIRSASSTKSYLIGRHSYKCEDCGYVHETVEREVECVECEDTYKTRNIKGNVCESCIQAERQRINKEIARVNRERTLALLQPKRMIEWLLVRKNRLARNIEREKQRELARIEFETKVHITNCTKCNKLLSYIGHRKTVCDECIRTNTRRLEYDRDKRRRKRMQKNGKYNSEIDLDAVIDRYDNVCYLCGGLCDKTDHEWKSGVFYVGRNYPSVEHVIPISKGGTHTWDNVNLAHHYCNSIKSDTV